jgi:hypothetical protein
LGALGDKKDFTERAVALWGIARFDGGDPCQLAFGWFVFVALVLERMALLELQIRLDSSLLPYRVKAFGLTIKLAGASGAISDHPPCNTWSAADVQSFDVIGSRSKRSNCASDDEADARR